MRGRSTIYDQIPFVKGKRGRPRHRPDVVQGDRAYDSEPHRRKLKKNGHRTAARETKHRARLGAWKNKMGG